MKPAYWRFSWITSWSQMKSWGQDFLSKDTHGLKMYFQLVQTSWGIFTSCSRITENSDFANSGIPYHIMLVRKRQIFQSPEKMEMFQKELFLSMQNFQPVRVWTVNFTLSFSDRASEISTCKSKSTGQDECPRSDGNDISGMSSILPGVFIALPEVSIFFWQVCLFCPWGVPLVYQGFLLLY